MKERRCGKCGIEHFEYGQYTIPEGLSGTIVCVSCYAIWWENFNKKSRIEEKHMERRIQQGETQYNPFDKDVSKIPTYLGLIKVAQSNILIAIEGLKQRDVNTLSFNKLDTVEIELEIALIELKKIAIGK